MLAQNFKTAADLDLADAEFEALVKVLGMLERGGNQAAAIALRNYLTTGEPRWDEALAQ